MSSNNEVHQPPKLSGAIQWCHRRPQLHLCVFVIFALCNF